MSRPSGAFSPGGGERPVPATGGAGSEARCGDEGLPVVVGAPVPVGDGGPGRGWACAAGEREGLHGDRWERDVHPLWRRGRSGGGSYRQAHDVSARGKDGADDCYRRWAELVVDGFSPFKVVCRRTGKQLAGRGGARQGGDGFVSVGGGLTGTAAPQSGAGWCTRTGRGRSSRRARSAGSRGRSGRTGCGPLRERAAAGDADTKGRVVLDLAELAA